MKPSVCACCTGLRITAHVASQQRAPCRGQPLRSDAPPPDCNTYPAATSVRCRCTEQVERLGVAELQLTCITIYFFSLQKDRRSPKTWLLRLIVPMAAKKTPICRCSHFLCYTVHPPSLTHPSPRIHSTVSTFLTSYRTSVPLCTVTKISVRSADELRCICAFVISVLKAWLSWHLRCFLMGHNREDNTHGYTWLADNVNTHVQCLKVRM